MGGDEVMGGGKPSGKSNAFLMRSRICLQIQLLQERCSGYSIILLLPVLSPMALLP